MLRRRGVRLVGERLLESPPLLTSAALRERGACLAIGCRSYPCCRPTVLDLENGVWRVWRLPTVDSFPTFFFASNLLFVAWLLVAFSVFEIATVSFESVRGLATRIPVFEDREIPGGPSVAFAFVACVPPGV